MPEANVEYRAIRLFSSLSSTDMPLQVGRASLSQVDSHIHHRTPRDAYQLGLRHRCVLEVDAAKCPLLRRKGLIVLHEYRVDAHGYKGSVEVGFHEITAKIAKTCGSMIHTPGRLVRSFSSVQHFSYATALRCSPNGFFMITG